MSDPDTGKMPVLQESLQYFHPMNDILNHAVKELVGLLPAVSAMAPEMDRLGQAMLQSWSKGGKILVAGNGGSAADAMHLAEELVARFMKNRRALAAIALCDPTVITCAANDFGFDSIFSRQVEALGNPGDVLIVFTTSGNSKNILRAIEAAKERNLTTAAFLGKDGGQARGQCDLEFVVNCNLPHRIQEIHQILYHSLCEWVDQKFN
jgi:D-sedoheptulose 7-phosphate isomerase